MRFHSRNLPYQRGCKKIFNDESATLDIKLKVDIADKKRSGTNVIGYINNGRNHGCTGCALRSFGVW